MQINFGTVKKLVNLAKRAYGEYQKIQEPSKPQRQQDRQQPSRARHESPRNSASTTSSYPGDYRGNIDFSYSPNPNGQPDPGEVVWTWVPYEEDYSQGKDRPVLLIGRNGQYLLALMLTSKDHNNSHEHDNTYLDVGSGPWDKQGRPSEVKLNRVIQVRPNDVRREGAIMDAGNFKRVQKAFEQTNN